MLENISDLNKVKVDLLNEEKSKKELFLDAMQFGYSILHMLSQTYGQNSQCISKYGFLWKHLSSQREFSNPV